MKVWLFPNLFSEWRMIFAALLVLACIDANHAGAQSGETEVFEPNDQARAEIRKARDAVQLSKRIESEIRRARETAEAIGIAPIGEPVCSPDIPSCYFQKSGIGEFGFRVSRRHSIRSWGGSEAGSAKETACSWAVAFATGVEDPAVVKSIVGLLHEAAEIADPPVTMHVFDAELAVEWLGSSKFTCFVSSRRSKDGKKQRTSGRDRTPLPQLNDESLPPPPGPLPGLSRDNGHE